MAADSLARQRRMLLPIALLLACSAALAGGLAVSLFSRLGAAPLPPQAAAAMTACATAPAPLADPDPMAVLSAALGEARDRPMAGPPGRPAAASLDGLLAPVPPSPPAATAASTAPAPAPTTPPATPPAAAPAALIAPAIAAGYRLDLGYFLEPDQAVAFATQVQDRGVPVQLVALTDPSGRVWTHVRTPPFAGSAQALAGAERIERSLGIPARLVVPETNLAPPTTGGPAP